MALPRKGSRCISVEDITYRWVVSPNDGFMVLTVELADHPGHQLRAHFGYQDILKPKRAGEYATVGQLRSITPAVVHSLIFTALNRGWQPSRRGLPPFQLQDAEQLAPTGEPDS